MINFKKRNLDQIYKYIIDRIDSGKKISNAELKGMILALYSRAKIDLGAARRIEIEEEENEYNFWKT